MIGDAATIQQGGALADSWALRFAARRIDEGLVDPEASGAFFDSFI